MKNSNWFVLSFVLVALSLGAPGCGGGGSRKFDPQASQSLTDAAMALLGQGSIAQSRDQFDDALDADRNNARAAFGAAFTRLILLIESDPSNRILQALGQSPAQIANLLGPQGYLAATHSRNQAEVTMNGLPNPHLSETYYGISTINNRRYGNCAYSEVISQIKGTDGLEGEIHFFLSVQNLNDPSQDYHLAVGVPTDMSQTINVCGWSFNKGYVEELRWNIDEEYYPNYPYSGTLTLNQSAGAEGDTVSYSLNDYNLINAEDPDWRNPTLYPWNLSVTDQITATPVSKVGYLPFADLRKRGELLNRAEDSIDASGYIAYLSQYEPLIEQIGDLLSLADQSDSNFQFIIPKELYFGTKDIPVNQSDLKSLRSGMAFFLAGIHFANSWEFPLEVGTLFNEAGERLISKQEVVDQLNQFFRLKSDNQLREAEADFAEGLQLAVEALDGSQQISTDGVIDSNPDTVAGYEELESITRTIQASLNGTQSLTFMQPAIDISLEHFFNHPPDAADLDFDPFVLNPETDDIQPVEAFFQQLFQGSFTVDIAANYRKAFGALSENHFKNRVLDEFAPFFVAGGKTFDLTIQTTDDR